jgi:hypothetical protein
MINNIIFKLITINLYKYNLAYSHHSHAIIDHLNSMHYSNFALLNAEIGRQGIHNQLLHHQLHTVPTIQCISTTLHRIRQRLDARAYPTNRFTFIHKLLNDVYLVNLNVNWPLGFP